jgi:hypothetical protein
MRRLINASLIMLALGVGVAACDRADEGKRTEAPGPAKDKTAGMPAEKDKTAGMPSEKDKTAGAPGQTGRTGG